MSRRVVDVSNLPTFAFGSRGLVWWGTVSLMIIEGTMFVLGIVSYFYLQGQEYDWPPGATRYPGLTFATINTVILLISAIPNQSLKKHAEKLDEGEVRKGLLKALAFAVVFLIVRAFEFTQLGVPWNYNAYGSILWTLLGLHTAHLLTDAFDTGVLAAMSYRTPMDGRRFVDVAENCIYWDFVVVAWLPIYFVVYLYPRI